MGEGALPPLLTCSAERIAQEAYDGFMRGRRLVVPGFANKVTTVLPRFLPRGFVLWAAAAYQVKGAPPKPKDP